MAEDVFRGEQSNILYRLDERTIYLQKELERMSIILSSHYVTMKEFTPVKNIVYGMVAVITVSVLGSIITLVITK